MRNEDQYPAFIEIRGLAESSGSHLYSYQRKKIVYFFFPVNAVLVFSDEEGRQVS